MRFWLLYLSIICVIPVLFVWGDIAIKANFNVFRRCQEVLPRCCENHYCSYPISANNCSDTLQNGSAIVESLLPMVTNAANQLNFILDTALADAKRKKDTETITAIVALQSQANTLPQRLQCTTQGTDNALSGSILLGNAIFTILKNKTKQSKCACDISLEVVKHLNKEINLLVNSQSDLGSDLVVAINKIKRICKTALDRHEPVKSIDFLGLEQELTSAALIHLNDYEQNKSESLTSSIKDLQQLKQDALDCVKYGHIVRITASRVPVATAGTKAFTST